VLHAAVLDPRINRVVIENTLASFRMVLDQPLHRDISEIMIPGVLAKYDMGDLLAAIAPRSVTVINPRDATGAAVDGAQFRKDLSYVFASGRSESGSPDRESESDRVRVVERAAPGPLPLD
jgi:hypothetical protein